MVECAPRNSDDNFALLSIFFNKPIVPLSHEAKKKENWIKETKKIIIWNPDQRKLTEISNKPSIYVLLRIK